MDTSFSDMAILRPAFLAVCTVFPLVASGAVVDFSVPSPKNPEPAMRVFGPYVNCFLGSSLSEAVASRAMAYGDFDGNGLDDLALGAPLGQGPIGLDDGTIWILFGGTGWKRSDVFLASTTVDERFAHILPEANEDHTGQALTAGDINGDGVDDLVIGAPLASPLNRFFGGRITILFGSATLPGQTINFTQPQGTYGECRLLPQSSSMVMGVTVASGDFNVDGFDDVAIASQFLNGSPRGIYVLFGGATLGGQTFDLANSTTRATLAFVDPGTSSGMPGVNMDVGDYNGDGRDDLLFNGNESLEILHGSGSFVAGTFDFLAPAQNVLVTHLQSATFDDRAAVASFDQLDIDPGADEVFFGVESAQTGAGPSIRGKFGRVTGIALHAGTSLFLDGTDASLASTVSNTTVTGDCGTTILIEDLDGDGAAEIGPVISNGLRGELRAINLSLLPASGSSLLNEYPVAWNAIHSQPVANALGSATLGGGDLDGDGAPDLAIAAPFQTDPQNASDRPGMVGIAFGSNLGSVSSASRFVVPGAEGWRGFGGRRSPRIRMWAKVDSGQSSKPVRIDATIHRGTSPLPTATAASVFWEVAEKKGVGGRLQLRATEEELGMIDPASLIVHRSDSPAGPWVPLDTTRRGDFIFDVHPANLAGYYALIVPPAHRDEGWIVW